jgi:nitrite reductase/ring-hydroxylating ferredoxin subunit
MPGFVKVATTSEVPPGQAKQVQANGKAIALFNLGGSYHAIDNTCPHRGGPLAEGEVEGNAVTCPWHGAKFSVTSGEVLSPPARAGVASYRTRVNGQDIEVEI